MSYRFLIRVCLEARVNPRIKSGTRMTKTVVIILNMIDHPLLQIRESSRCNRNVRGHFADQRRADDQGLSFNAQPFFKGIALRFR